MLQRFIMKSMVLLFLSLSLYASTPQLSTWSLNADSIQMVSKYVRIDSIKATAGGQVTIDTITTITWNGSVVFSCTDSSNDSMGVFIDVVMALDTVSVDSVWGATTVVSGNNYKSYFAFHNVFHHWTGKVPAQVRLSLDDVYLSYKGRPKITVQPENVSTLLELQAKFSVTAVGTPAPSYEWKLNGKSIAGANAAALIIPSVDTTQAGTYCVVVSNGIGSVTSNNVTLTVNYTPIIIMQPISDTVDVGSSALFTVSARAYPGCTYQWKKDGVAIPNDTNKDCVVPNITMPDSGTYTVVVSNLIGNTTSKEAVLTVNYAPLITVQPKEVTARIGQSSLMKVTAQSRPIPTYQWQKNGVDIVGETYASLGIEHVSLQDSGLYTVVVTNRLGVTKSNPVSLKIDPVNLTTDSMITIAGGTFTMGKLGLSDPVHDVTLHTFKIGNTFVTQRDYVRVMGVNPSRFSGDSILPIENVSWFDAVLYCNAKSRMENKDTVYSFTAITGNPGNGVTALANIASDHSKNGYRLPTEAEYEYACRAGTNTDYYWGGSYPPITHADTVAINCNAVWYYNSGNKTNPVGTKRPNAWGLYDIVGQLWQWHDEWQGGYSSVPETDPVGPATGYSRNVRGGSWSPDDDDRHLRSMARNGGYEPQDRSWIVGFRVVSR